MASFCWLVGCFVLFFVLLFFCSVFFCFCCFLFCFCCCFFVVFLVVVFLFVCFVLFYTANSTVLHHSFLLCEGQHWDTIILMINKKISVFYSSFAERTDH